MVYREIMVVCCKKTYGTYKYTVWAKCRAFVLHLAVNIVTTKALKD